mmetsp:Transcript_29626/g.47660  ORF Transcript_29626/g.47660 Transcript_29626/m.47660 type:complete len:412 (+) Transcript_29626:143-1378(+)
MGPSRAGDRLACSGSGDDYYSGEMGSLFFAPNAWPDSGRHPPAAHLRPAMEAYYARMETLSTRLHRLLAEAMGAPPDFFDRRIDRHCSNLQVANYPTIDPQLWSAEAEASPAPLRKKAHADSGTITILARGAAGEGAAGGLQVRVPLLGGGGAGETWANVPVLSGGIHDGDASALLVNLGNQAQRWSDDRWRSTMHRVTNPPTSAPAPRRISIAYFHKVNYDAVIDPRDFVPTEAGAAVGKYSTGRQSGAVGGYTTGKQSGDGAGGVPGRCRYPPVRSGDISRVGLLYQAAAQGLDATEASMRYHSELMGGDAAAEAAAATVPHRTTDASSGLGLDRGGSEKGAGAGNANPAGNCPVCSGTGWKPCGQCSGTGINQEDLFGGKFVKGDTCWLCAGKCQTMCGNCVDLTDRF